MAWVFGSIPILMYPAMGEEVPFPPFGFFLLTDLTNLLMTDNDPLLTAGA